jgi:UDP:flavonoid glycosyltransferase YjiC (YdhE family)
MNANDRTILVMPDCGFLAHTSRACELALSLRKKNFKIIFAGTGKFKSLPIDNGFEFVHLDGFDPDLVIKSVRKGRVDCFKYEKINEIVKTEISLVEKIKPCMLVSDFRPTVNITGELTGIPTATLINSGWTNYYAAKLQAPEHFLLTKIIGKKIVTKFLPPVKQLILSRDGLDFNRARRNLGLSPRGNLLDQMRANINLIVDIPKYGPLTNQPKSFHYVGPITWEPKLTQPDWYEQISPSRPVLYFTMGSTGNTKIFDAAIEQFANSEFQCMITTAGMYQRKNFPSNFYVTDFAPGSALVKKANVVICQGGNGTIYQALQGGVPIIGIPTMHDQEFNMQRIEDLGLGITLSEIKFKPSDLRKGVELILNDPNFKSRALDLQLELREYTGSERAADIILEFLSNSR